MFFVFWWYVLLVRRDEPLIGALGVIIGALGVDGSQMYAQRHAIIGAAPCVSTETRTQVVSRRACSVRQRVDRCTPRPPLRASSQATGQDAFDSKGGTTQLLNARTPNELARLRRRHGTSETCVRPRGLTACMQWLRLRNTCRAEVERMGCHDRPVAPQRHETVCLRRRSSPSQGR